MDSDIEDLIGVHAVYIGTGICIRSARWRREVIRAALLSDYQCGLEGEQQTYGPFRLIKVVIPISKCSLRLSSFVALSVQRQLIDPRTPEDARMYYQDQSF